MESSGTYLMLADLMRISGRPDEAEVYYHQAIALAEEAGDVGVEFARAARERLEAMQAQR